MSHQVEFKIDGYTIRGVQWWNYRTMPPTLDGMTEERARQIAADAARQAAEAKRMQGQAE